MKLRYPSYYKDFQCIGGDCPDNCCHHWAVVLDEQTAAFYRAAPGVLGDKLRAAMTHVDGAPCFFLKDGVCPMQTARGLCEIQLAYGPEKLSRSCSLHPRFWEEYGALRECSLSLGCPAVARLLLAQKGGTIFLEETTPEPVTDCNNLNPQLFFALLAARKVAIAIAQDRTQPWRVRRARLLSFGDALQKKLAAHRIAQLACVTAQFATTPREAHIDATAAFWACLQALEPIHAQWKSLLAGAAQTPLEAEEEREQLTVYYLFRYFLKAVVDRRVRARVRLAVYSADAVGRLEQARLQTSGALSLADRVDLIHRYSREVEHAENNMCALLAALS